jgi:beta-lactamase regulating signal transducer with metallopeptidase domain
MEYIQLHSPFNIPKPLLFLFYGYLAVLVVVAIYQLFKGYIKRIPFRKTTKTTNLILFICNLVITLGGLAISLYALGISVGIITMSDSEKAQLAASINTYIYLVWAGFGIIFACIILWASQMFKRDESNWRDRPVDMDKLNAMFRKRVERKSLKIERRKKRRVRYEKVINKFKEYINQKSNR